MTVTVQMNFSRDSQRNSELPPSSASLVPNKPGETGGKATPKNDKTGCPRIVLPDFDDGCL